MGRLWGGLFLLVCVLAFFVCLGAAVTLTWNGIAALFGGFEIGFWQGVVLAVLLVLCIWHLHSPSEPEDQ